MSRHGELIKNTLILGLGKMSTQLISFLLLPLYTLFLSPTDYGTVDLVITYIALCAPIITLQLEMAAFRLLVDARSDNNEKTKVISNTLHVAGLLLFIFTVFYLIIDRFIAIPYATLILLGICATIFSNLLLQFARGLGENKSFAAASLIAGLVTILFNITFIVIFHMGAKGMLTAMVLANIASSIYLFLSLRLYRYVTIRSNKKLQKTLLRYSMPLVPNGVSWWVINASDRTIISMFLGLSANGIFAIAYKFPIIFTSLFSVFSMSWTESASVHINDKDRDTFFSQTFNASIRLFGSLGLALIVFIPILFPLMVKPAYNEAYLYIPILIIGAFFNSMVGLYSAIYVAKKLTKQVASTSLVAAGINIGLTLIFIHLFGLYAAAAATAIAYLAMTIYRHHDIKKYVAITYEKNLFVKMAVLYAIAMSFYYFNNMIGNIISAVIITIIIILLNKSAIRIMKVKVMSKTRRKPKLNPEQEANENSL